MTALLCALIAFGCYGQQRQQAKVRVYNTSGYSRSNAQYRWGQGLLTAGGCMMGATLGFVAVYPLAEWGINCADDAHYRDSEHLGQSYKDFFGSYGALCGCVAGAGLVLAITGAVLRNSSGVYAVSDFKLGSPLKPDADDSYASLSLGATSNGGFGLQMTF